MNDITLQRLHNQQIVNSQLKTPGDVVTWLGAVQSQEYHPAKWALGLRLRGFTDDDIERAYNDGLILRTHVLRPTWHFVAPEDIRWLLELTGPRVHGVNGTMYRKLELDDTTLRRSDAAIARALGGGNHLTRKELASALGQAGIPEPEGLRLTYMVMHAELDGVICSGARRGKQFTYALLDERVPPTRKWSRDEALAEITTRYFTSHGPATAHDLARWSGLTLADVKEGLELAGASLVEEVIDGISYWRSVTMPDIIDDLPTAFLLPPYDEYTNGYKDYSIFMDAKYAEPATTLPWGGAIIMHRKVIGYWRPRAKKNEITLELFPFRPISDDEMEAIEVAAQRYSEFMGLPIVLEQSHT